LDIGGANLKVADGLGYAVTEPFRLWLHPDQLAYRLRSLFANAPAADCLAITMTGELADCFVTKAEGVAAIVDAVRQSADGRIVQFYRADGRFVSADQAVCEPDEVASANWHALARFAASQVERHGLLVDIGSTTTDLIPLMDREPVATGTTDLQRLIHSELVYSGVWRTPVASVVQSVPWRSERCPVAQELFSTMIDVYLTLGEIAELPEDNNTADGRAATKAAARDRLARMLCTDRREFTDEDATRFSRAAADNQFRMIAGAAKAVIRRLPSDPEVVITSGFGEFLARRIASTAFPDAEIWSLSEHAGSAVSICAPAHAVAVLAREFRR
jgi:probable H4MPT-linked C1 transfer pathway protein